MNENLNQLNQTLSQCLEYTNFVAKAFCEGGVVMYLIAVVGVLALLLIFERLIAFQKFNVDKEKLTSNLFRMILQGDVRQAISFCDNRSAPLTNTIKAGLVQILNKSRTKRYKWLWMLLPLRKHKKL